MGVVIELPLALAGEDPGQQPQRRDGQRASGRFASRYAAFMPLRHTVHATTAGGAAIATAINRRPRVEESLPERDTDALVLPTWQALPWFLSALRLPVAVTFGYTIDPGQGEPSHVIISHNHDRHRVTETGPTRLWIHVENAHRRWTEWGQPGWDRLGLTVDTTARTQVLWLDQPEHPIATLPHQSLRGLTAAPCAAGPWSLGRSFR